jgi:uncharacterized protein YgiM (DUF1202 family)
VSGLNKVIRGLIGLAVVLVLLFTVRAWYDDYKVAARKTATLASSSNASRTVDATAVVPVQGQRVAILVDGLSLRSAPETSTKAVRPLKKGEQLLLVGVTQSNWLQLRDTSGKLGFVLNNVSAVKVQK